MTHIVIKLFIGTSIRLFLEELEILQNMGIMKKDLDIFIVDVGPLPIV